MMREKLEEGYVYFVKNGKIEAVKAPTYGHVAVNYQQGKAVTHEVKQTYK